MRYTGKKGVPGNKSLIPGSWTPADKGGVGQSTGEKGGEVGVERPGESRGLEHVDQEDMTGREERCGHRAAATKNRGSIN